MMIRCIPVATCAMCPFMQRHYGQNECSKFNFQTLPKQDAENGLSPKVPDWCPLPPHPSFAAPIASPADQVTPWISVDERLPDAAGEYLVYRPTAHLAPAADPNVCLREYAGLKNPGERWQGAHRVTHWMPLPPPPSASKEGS